MPCKIWRKTDFCFGKGQDQFLKFSPEHLEVLKLWSFCPKKKMRVLKIYRGDTFNDTEEWRKRKNDLSFLNWGKEIDKFWLEHSKVSKICTLMVYFWPKYIMFEPKKYREGMCDSTEDWYKIWRKSDSCFQKWHEESGKFEPEHSKVSKLGLSWDPFTKSGNFMTSKLTGELCGMTTNNDAKMWRGIDLSVQNWHDKFIEFWPEHSKISDMCTLMSSFWPKYVMSELREYRRVTFDGNEDR